MFKQWNEFVRAPLATLPLPPPMAKRCRQHIEKTPIKLPGTVGTFGYERGFLHCPSHRIPVGNPLSPMEIRKLPPCSNC